MDYEYAVCFGSGSSVAWSGESKQRILDVRFNHKSEWRLREEFEEFDKHANYGDF